MIEAPAPGRTDIGKPGLLVPQEPEYTKDDVTRAGGVCHDFEGPPARLLFQQTIEDEHRIPQRPWNDDAMEARALIGGEIVIGDASAGIRVFTIRARVERAHGHDKPQAICRRHSPPTPGVRSWTRCLGIDKTGIGPDERLCPDIVLLDLSLSRPRVSAGPSGRIPGSRPILQASASSTAQRLTGRSATRASPALMCVNSWAHPVRAWISSSTSGRSTCGKWVWSFAKGHQAAGLVHFLQPS